MTGQELLQGFSFVDERFIAEAETAVFGRKVLWMKILSVAACLCILLTGAMALGLVGDKVVREEAAAPAAPALEMITESAREEAAPKEEVSVEAPIPPYPVEESSEIPYGELQQIPFARLRVVKVLEDGSFEAIAEAIQEMEVDTNVIVIVDPSKVPGQTEEITTDLSDIVEDTVFTIEDGAYDAERNILYVAEVFPVKD